MATIKAFIILFFWTSTLIVSSQTISDDNAESSFIEMIGSAEKDIVPDEIYIAITIRERQEGKEKITIDKQEADMRNALISIDVPLESLSLSDANSSYIRVKWTKKEVVTKNEYVVKVGDALSVGKVFEKLDDLKIVDAHISRVTHSKLEDYKRR